MARTTYTVSTIRGSKRWKVEANGRTVSRHNKKKNAVEKAKDLKDRNDTLTVKNKNGRFGKRL